MKNKRNLLIVILLSGILGWVLGYLRLPYLEKNFSFLLGFIACLVFLSLVFLLLNIWNKNAILLKLLGKQIDATNAQKSYFSLWGSIAVFIFVGGLIGSFFFFQQNKNRNTLQANYDNKINYQLQLLEATRKSNSLILINSTLEKILKELENSSDKKLSNKTIQELATLNYSFQPYQIWEGDSLSHHKLSPERGQLLLGLAKMDMDSNSFNQIKKEVSFSGADLENANLSGTNLNHVILQNARLKNAVLNDAKLNNANLEDAILWGSQLNRTNLSSANLKKANLQWAEVNEAILANAILNGANLSSAKFKATDLSEVNLEWAIAQGTQFNNAQLIKTNFIGTDLRRSNLNDAVLDSTNFKFTNLKEVNLSNTNLNGVNLDRAIVTGEDWIDKLSNWNVINADEIKKKYKTVIYPHGDVLLNIIKE